METYVSNFYDGRRRSKIVLSSDFECCQKYKHTLPDHVELVGGSDSYEKLRSASTKSKLTPSAESLRTQSIASSKSDGGSDLSKEHVDSLEMIDEIVEEPYHEVEVEMGEEEEEYESSICSEWIVLKPSKRRRKKKEIIVESSVSDLNEPAGCRRLLKRPPSPDGEVFDEESRPKNFIPSNFFKYKDLEEWPEPPPIEKALLKREPSPNMSFPRSSDNLELAGEDWLWFEGHYMEGGDLEIHGEGELYYRLPKQWREGHWEPAPALLERWEREELEQEKERQRVLEEKRRYEEIIKREDSPGMDIINWGDGPVKLTEWMKYISPKSLKDLSNILPTSVSDQLVRIASEVSPEIFSELLAKVDEAMIAENSLLMIQQLLDAYIGKGLDVVESKVAKTAVGQDSNAVASTSRAMSLQEESKIASNKSVRFIEEPQASTAEEVLEDDGECIPEEQSVEEAEEEQAPIIRRPKIIRDDPCDPLPESFRDTLLEFIKDFVEDKPGDPLTYAIGYFQSRIPKIEDYTEKSHSGELDSHSQVAPDRRLAAFCTSSKQSDRQSVDEGEIEEYAKTPKEIEILVRAMNSCWVTRDLDLATVIALVKTMNQIDVVENDVIQSADMKPDTFYVIKRGAFKIQNDFGVKVLRDRGYFGELSLNEMISESLKAPYSAISLKRGSLWCLKRSDYLRIKDNFKKNKNTILFSMMGVMDLFDNLTEEEKQTVVDCLDMRYFKRKDIIFCQDSAPEGIYFFLDGVFKLIKIDQERGSAGSSVRASIEDNSQKEKKEKKKKFYTASAYPAPRVLGYGNFVDNRPWGYSCVARSNIVQVAILKTDVFERLLGDPEDVLTRPPPPPPRPRPFKKMFSDRETYGELHGEYYGEYAGEEMGEEAAPPPPPPPKVIPWLKKKVDVDPDEPPKPKPPPTYEEIMAAMWGTKPVYEHPKDSACLCGLCKNTVTCVGQGMKCCDKPKVQIETLK